MPSNVGVVGYGFSAKTFHIPFVRQVPDLNLYAVVQRTPKPDDDAEKDHPGVKSFRSTEDMVRDAAVDVVIVTTAPDSHYPLTKLALENGKHGQLADRQIPAYTRQILTIDQSSARNPSRQPTRKQQSSMRWPKPTRSC
jgi:hypothetical protein